MLGRARGLNGAFGSWISGKTLQGGLMPIQSPARRVLLPGYRPLAPGPATLPTNFEGGLELDDERVAIWDYTP